MVSASSHASAPPVRLGSKILGHLKRWRRLDPHATHVVHWNGQPIVRFSNSWPIVLARAGLEDDGVTLHTLRHTRATWLLQKGIDAWQVSGHLGMTLTTLQRVYGHHAAAYQKEAADA
jgi:integrase